METSSDSIARWKLKNDWELLPGVQSAGHLDLDDDGTGSLHFTDLYFLIDLVMSCLPLCILSFRKEQLHIWICLAVALKWKCLPFVGSKFIFFFCPLIFEFSSHVNILVPLYNLQSTFMIFDAHNWFVAWIYETASPW